MANFTSNSTSYLDHNDLNWDLLNPFITNTNDSTFIQNSIMDYQSLLGFSGDHQLLTQSSSSSSLAQEKLHGTTNNPINISGLENTDITCGRRNIELGRIAKNKRKAEELPGFCSLNSSSPVSSSDVHKTGKAKRTKSSDKVAGEKPKEVVHVRAKRGHATDSHSIAERVRRGKINERLKHLQDIVPGCHKTMGMAPMLDEIINYVQSLQNQVEFLSMKLTAASHFHDFNADMEPQHKPQCGSMQRMNALCNTNTEIEAQDMESIITQSGYDEAVANVFQQTWPF